jgi:hypothetical protein
MKRLPWAEFALFASVFLAYVASPIATPFDSRWTVYTALSLIHDHNFDLNEYRVRLEADGYYAIECVPAPGERVYSLPGGPGIAEVRACSGRLYNFYPVAVPMLAAPLVAGLEASLHVARPLLEPLVQRTPPGYRRSLLEGDLARGSMPAELIVASFITALACLVVFRLARGLAAWPVALGVALVFAFASPAWSTASRALWQHTFSMLLLPLALACLLRSRWAWAGALFMLAFFVRPTNAIPCALAGLWMLTLGRRQTLRFVLGALPVAAVFLAINWSMYGLPLAPYFFIKRANSASLGLHPRFAEALLGHLVSPSRGLFVFCPVFLFSLYGMWLWARQRATRRLGLFLAAGLVAHYLLIASFEHWWGGHSYGPRFFADLAPYLSLALIPAWAALVHSQGALSPAGINWDVSPVEVDANPARVWDWRDPQFLRGWR